MPKEIPVLEVREWDEICITGVCTSESPLRRFEAITGIVGTMQREWQELKLWPKDIELQRTTDGKLWFPFDQIEKVELLRRYDDNGDYVEY